jgi:hypothetical protein
MPGTDNEEKMINSSKSAMAILLGLFLAGCGAQPGTSLVKWDGVGSRVTDAPQNARYALYSSAAANPDVSYSLNRGDSIGFVSENGHTFAIAGSHKDEIRPGRVYYWKMQKD